jgi:hypothetical protein
MGGREHSYREISMADATISIAFPVRQAAGRNIAALVLSFVQAVTGVIRRRWIYHRTLAELENYSERSLHDIGADRGIEEFARRAARL